MKQYFSLALVLYFSVILDAGCKSESAQTSPKPRSERNQGPAVIMAPSSSVANPLPSSGPAMASPMPPQPAASATPGLPSAAAGLVKLQTDARYAKARDEMGQRAQAWFSKKDWSFVDGGTCTVSCHTTTPFVLADPLLDTKSRDIALALYKQIQARVDNWAQVKPVYSFSPADSRGSEAILNAVSMIAVDTRLSGKLEASTCKAVANAFALQTADGAFPWMNSNLEPFERKESGVFGAALFYFSLGPLLRWKAEQRACLQTDFSERMKAIQGYLKAKVSTAPLHDKIWILMADSMGSERAIITSPAGINDILNPALAAAAADGGLQMKSLGIPPKTNYAYKNDTYATALVALAALLTADPAWKQKTEKQRAWLDGNAETEAYRARSYNNPEAAFNNLLSEDMNKGIWLLYRKVLAETGP